MKIVSAIIFFLFANVFAASAQWSTIGNNIFNTNYGNVGVGLSSPVAKLQVNTPASDNDETLLKLGHRSSSVQVGTIIEIGPPDYSTNGVSRIIGYSNPHNVVSSKLALQTWNGSSWNNLIMDGVGNVGIGTASPVYQLDVSRTGGGNLGAWARLGSIYAAGEASGSYPSIGYNINSNNNSFKYAATDFASWIKFQAGGLQFHTAPSGTSGVVISSTQAMTILQNGNVGIGLSAPQAKLDVNGTTYSRKLFVGTPDANTITNMGNNLLAVNGTAVFVKAKVALYGTAWPDYVFTSAYRLPRLDSLEQFIKLNGHLPEVPKAEEVEKNGIDLGSNQALLLKKIEELTLIVIEQNKRIEKLEKEAKQ